MVRWLLPPVWIFMGISSCWSIGNRVRITVEDQSGNVLRTVEKNNITCNAWRGSIAQRLVNSSIAEKWSIRYIAVWDDTQTSLETRTVLKNETYRSPILSVRTIVSGTTLKVYARFNQPAVINIEEAWLFLDAEATAALNSGSLLAYSTWFPVVTKQVSEVVTIEWTVYIENKVI